MRVLCQLAVIIEEADQPEPDRDEQDDPDIRIGQISPQQGRDAQREQNEETAHRRRSLLAQQMAVGTVGANRLPIALLPPQPKDEAGTENKADQEGGDDRPSRAECDVAEQVEDLELVREGVQQRVQPQLMSFAGPIPRTAWPRCG